MKRSINVGRGLGPAIRGNAMNTAHRKFLAAIALLLVGSIVATPAAIAEPETSYARVAKLYSTMDGSAQAIELDLVIVNATPLVLAGKVLTVRDRSGKVRWAQTLSGKFDGPILRPNLLLSTFSNDDWDGIPLAFADVQMESPILRIVPGQPYPYGFPIANIPIYGGTIEIEGMDSWTFGPLPLSGMHALARDGSIVPSILNRYMREPWNESEIYTTIVDWANVNAVEFYHEGMDHYFLTTLESEIELLDSGQVPGWKRTHESIRVLARLNTAITGSVPVCRSMKNYPGGYSHILSSIPYECSLLAADSSGTFESAAAFHVIPADPVTGSCPNDIWIDYPLLGGQSRNFRYNSTDLKVYRFWNGKSDGNHRFVRSWRYAQLREMSEKGWISEGYGSDGTAFCDH